MTGTIFGKNHNDINGDDVFINFSESSDFEIGQRVEVYHLKEGVTAKQRGMYFVLLAYSLEVGMRDFGHFSVDGLHEDVKGWVRETHPNDFGKNFGLRTISKGDVSLLIEMLIDEFFIALCHVDVSGFFVEYEKFKAWESKMLERGEEVTFRQYWKVRGAE